MARKALIEKEKKRAKLVALKLEKRRALKKVVRDLNNSPEEKVEAMRKLNKLPKNSSPIRQRTQIFNTFSKLSIGNS